jgi:zinc D-Ala-D-Ala carboxypeptidase
MQSFQKFWNRWWFLVIATLITLGIGVNGYVAVQFSRQRSSAAVQAVTAQHQLTLGNSAKPTPPATNQPSPRKSQVALSQKSDSGRNVTLLGHFPYLEGDVSKMLPVGSYAQGDYQRFERLMPEAAFALMKLIYAARDEGVWIIPVSGFRDLEGQKKLFEAQIQRRGSREAAAKSSAPPGYSEHHTGYTLDFADGNFPRQDISLDFAKTAAFRWMKLHAKEFGFELSFPENNAQGVNYEPWHWRFIGTSEASQIFKHPS